MESFDFRLYPLPSPEISSSPSPDQETLGSYQSAYLPSSFRLGLQRSGPLSCDCSHDLMAHLSGKKSGAQESPGIVLSVTVVDSAAPSPSRL